MTIEFRCSQCNQLLRVPDTSAGKNARCPKCQALMQVPAGESTGAALPPPPPGFTPSGSGDAPTFGPPPPPPPPPPTSSDPFAFLNAGGGTPGGGPSLPPPPKNPFGDAGGAAPFGGKPIASHNPYASPTLQAGGYSGSAAVYGPRSGLPWETKGQRFATWWETMAMILSSPTGAFTQMKQYGGLGSPLMFAIWGMMAPVLAIMALVIPVILIISIAVGTEEDLGLGIGMGVGMIMMMLLFGILYVLVAATIGSFVSAAIYHVCLIIVGGAQQGYETTFRVVCYVQGALGPIGILLSMIPYIGPFAHLVWMIVVLSIGLARAHEVPTGKAVFAVLLPVIAFCVLCFGLMVIFVAIGALSEMR